METLVRTAMQGQIHLILWVTLLNAGELKVREGTHETEPMGLLGGEVGLEKHTTPQKKLISCV